MDSDKKGAIVKQQIAVEKGLLALLHVLPQYLEKGIEIERLCRVSVLLIKSGAYKYNKVFDRIARKCVKAQKTDGGWIGVEDSAWCVALLRELDFSSPYLKGLDWIKKQQLSSGSWGKTDRDYGRIVITGLILFLTPELSNKNTLKWLETEWRKEFSSNPALTYKCAFSLLSLNGYKSQLKNDVLFNNSFEWLQSQQNNDCGWGPFKGHPVGSTPFCTGVALTGLLHNPEKADKQIIANGLKWIETNQLENGLWSDHYIEEGSAWCFYALTEGYKFLRARQ